MKKSESRFFINWQMPKDDATLLYASTSDKERTQLLEKWVSRNSSLIQIADVTEEAHWSVIITFFEGHFDLARKANFSQLKMSCFLEIMLYLLKQLLTNRLPEEKSF